MKKPASQKWRLLFSKNFILMLVMLVVIIMTISAWFTVHKTVTANNMTVKALTTDLQIADAKKTYDSNGILLTDGPDDFGPSLNVNGIELTKDCTGTGGVSDSDGKLIVPEFNVTRDYDSVRTHGGKDVNVNVSGSPAMSNLDAENAVRQHPNQDPPEYQYFEKEFYIRSSNPEIYLDSSSFLISFTESNGNVLTNITGSNQNPNPNLAETNPKRSAYGNFNVDGLVGAIRVAIVGEECTAIDEDATNNFAAPNATRNSKIKQLTWLPRPDLKLFIPDTPNDISNWKLLKVPATNNYSNTKHTYYRNNEGNGNVELVEDDNSTLISSSTKVESGVTIPCLGRQANISKFVPDSEQFNENNKIWLIADRSEPNVKEEYYVAKYTLKIWIEGTDEEARRAMDGGQFSLEILFR